MSWKDRISVDSGVCHGKACNKGTRIMVMVIRGNPAAGETADRILASYASMEKQDIEAALRNASEMARERVVTLPGASD